MKKIISILFIILITTILLSVLSGCGGGTSTPRIEFVHVDAQKFMIGDKPFYFQGNNTYYAGLCDLTESEINSIMSQNAQKGIRVMRIWGFNNGSGTGAIQTSLGNYNENSLKRLDYAVYKAKENHIRLIIPLVNNWDDYGGITWYVEQTLGLGHNKEEFYSSPIVKQAYKNYVQKIINRTNYYTNIQLKDEPTIFAWELINEPQLTDNYDTTGAIIYNWINEMAYYIRSLDKNHMISTGEEGYKNGGIGWLDNGMKGLDFLRNISNENISFATIHVYPDTWSKTPAEIDLYIEDRAAIAHGINKPIILEEYGRLSSVGDRDSVFEQWHQTCRDNNFAGVMVWQMELNIKDINFGFSFNSSTANIIEANANGYNN